MTKESNVMTSIIMEPNTQSQTTHTKEQVNLCLTNLFQAPSQGIEKAFALVLELLEKQQHEHCQLQLAHDDLEKQNKDLLLGLREEFEESNAILKKQFDDDNEQLKESVEMLRTERDDLLKVNDELKGNQLTFQKVLNDMKEEVKTMAYNLQLEPTTEVFESNEDVQEGDKGDMYSESSSLGNETHENTEKIDLNTDNDIESQEELVSFKSGQNEGDDIVNEPRNMESHHEGDVLPQKQLSPSISDMSQRSLRKGSVLSHKLQVHETLAARLDRIENDKEKMKQDVVDIKRRLGSIHESEGIPSYTMIPDESKSIATLQQRLNSLEHFLSGFGVSSFDATGQVQCNTKESNNLPSKRKRSLEDRSVSDESSIDDSESDKISDTQSNAITENQEDENSTKQAPNSNEVQVDNLPVSSPYSSDEESTNDDIGENALIKPKGLLMHLLDQEKKFKQNLSLISERLVTLEDRLKSNIGRDLSSQQEETEEGGSTSDAAFYDDSILRANIDELKDALETLRNDVGSKVSKEMLTKELELHRSNSILTQLEGASGGSNVDDTILQQLQNMIQNELESLRKHKVDKESYTKEMDESKSQVLETVQKSLSNHEAQMTDSVTKLGNDVSHCKENIKTLQDMLEKSRYTTSEELNLDEKIKRATEEMESSLQEIISSRLSCLKAMEDEVERLTSGLAEKPDQDQINAMLRNLENAVSARIGSDDTFQGILQSLKSELKEKMTRNEVLFLLKQALNGAKEDVKRSGDSLMVGHQPYRCLSCDKVHPRGVNNALAPKVNHNSLPQGHGLAPPIYPYCSALGNGSRMMGRGGAALRPIRRSQSSIDSLRRSRSRRWTSSSARKKQTRQSR